MQDKYVSLDPNFASTKQSHTDREYVFEQRLNEASGGQYSQTFGIIAGVTAFTHFYARA